LDAERQRGRVVEPNVLANVLLFADFDEPHLREVTEQLRSRRYRRGETVFVAGDPGTSLCIVKSGRIKLALTSTEGREVILDILGSGEVFGELALLDGEPR
jgi:CRP-like cAMP-binding protein